VSRTNLNQTDSNQMKHEFGRSKSFPVDEHQSGEVEQDVHLDSEGETEKRERRVAVQLSPLAVFSPIKPTHFHSPIHQAPSDPPPFHPAHHCHPESHHSPAIPKQPQHPDAVGSFAQCQRDESVLRDVGLVVDPCSDEELSKVESEEEELREKVAG